jgi:hypothetical protein
MSTTFEVEYVWIPHAVGGHRSMPYQGLRAAIRWQKYVREYLERLRDVEAVEISCDSVTLQGSASLRMISDEPVPDDWLREGSLIELLDGYKVIAVGRVRLARKAAEGSA